MDTKDDGMLYLLHLEQSWEEHENISNLSFYSNALLLGRNIECNICHRKFSARDKYEKHVVRHHGQKVSFKCEFCDRVLKSRVNLKIHIRQHTGETPYLCTICNRGFRQISGLKYHMKKCLGGTSNSNKSISQSTCQSGAVCDKGFPRKRVNMKTRLGKRDVKKLPRKHSNVETTGNLTRRNIVAKGATESSTRDNIDKRNWDVIEGLGLRKELLSCDTLAKPKKSTVCETCGKTFQSNHALILHIRTRTGEKPYICSVCNRGFAQRSQLKTHMRCVHMKTYKDEGATGYGKSNCKRTLSKRARFSSNVVRDEEGSTNSVIPQIDLGRNTQITDCKQTVSEDSKNRDITRASTLAQEAKPVGEKEPFTVMYQNGKEVYKCVICSKVLTTKPGAVIHNRTHTGEKPYSCSVCCKQYRQLSNLNQHMRVHARTYKSSREAKPIDGKEPFNKVEGSANSIIPQIDLGNHSQESEWKQAVDEDSKNSDITQTSKLAQEAKPVGEKEPFTVMYQNGKEVYKCVYCAKVLITKTGAVIHHRTHTGYKPYSCTVCRKPFSHQLYLKVHMRVHTGEKPYVCEVCKKGFSQRGALNKHVKLHSTKSTQFTKVADKTLKRKSNLKQKAKGVGQRGAASVKCSTCNKVLSSRSALGTHMRIHEGVKPYRCTICKRGFVQGSHLKCHMNTHIGEKSYTSTIRHGRFPQKINLTRHMANIHKNTHTNEKAYTCLICHKGFTQKGNLRRHIANIHKNTHTSEKAYTCIICHKGFTQKSNLGRHMAIHARETLPKGLKKNKVLQYRRLKHSVGNSSNYANRTKSEESTDGHTVETTPAQESNAATSPNVTHARETFLKGLKKKKVLQYRRLKHSVKSDYYSVIHDNSSNHTSSSKSEEPTEEHTDESTPTQKADTATLPSVAKKRKKKVHGKTSHTMSASIPSSEKTYKCDICGKLLSQKQGLVIHMRWHRGERPFSCSFCNKKFSQNCHLRCHIKKWHHGKSLSSVTRCDKGSHNVSLEKIGRNQMSSVTRQASSTKDGSPTPDKKVRIGKNSYKCKICGKVVCSTNGLYIHLRTHTGERPYPCRVCHKRFSQTCHLKTHMNKVHMANASVKQKKESLAKSKKVLAGTRMKRVNKVGRESNSKQDTAVDNGDESYICTVCSEVFTTEMMLEEHMQGHVNENAFKCSRCDESFADKVDLIKHVVVHIHEM